LQGLGEKCDSKIYDYTHTLHHGDHAPPLLESSMKAQVIATDEKHIHTLIGGMGILKCGHFNLGSRFI